MIANNFEFVTLELDLDLWWSWKKKKYYRIKIEASLPNDEINRSKSYVIKPNHVASVHWCQSITNSNSFPCCVTFIVMKCLLKNAHIQSFRIDSTTLIYSFVFGILFLYANIWEFYRFHRKKHNHLWSSWNERFVALPLKRLHSILFLLLSTVHILIRW